MSKSHVIKKCYSYLNQHFLRKGIEIVSGMLLRIAMSCASRSYNSPIVIKTLKHTKKENKLIFIFLWIICQFLETGNQNTSADNLPIFNPSYVGKRKTILKSLIQKTNSKEQTNEPITKVQSNVLVISCTTRNIIFTNKMRLQKYSMFHRMHSLLLK